MLFVDAELERDRKYIFSGLLPLTLVYSEVVLISNDKISKALGRKMVKNLYGCIYFRPFFFL